MAIVPPGFDRDALNTLGKLISGLERFQLESSIPETFDPTDLLDESEQAFFRVRGLSDFWSHQIGSDFAQHLADLVIAAHNQRQADLTLILSGASQRLSLFLSLGSETATRSILEGIFPGIQLERVAIKDLVTLLETHFVVQGVLTGIPSQKLFGQSGSASGFEGTQQKQSQTTSPPSAPAPPNKQDTAHLERVIRGMYNATWAYVVQAHPRPRQKVIEDRMKTIDLLTQVTSRSRAQWQSSKQDSHQMTSTESGSQSQTFSGDMVNYRAQYLIRLLERELERLDQAAAAGQWTVHSYFGANTLDDAQRLASLLLGTLSGTDSRPEPLRAALCQPEGSALEAFYTYLTSQEVAALIQLPREEVPGYALHDYVRFDSDFSTSEQTTLPLGSIQHNGHDSNETFSISLDALTKHVVVVGVTGSGKTTTVMNLLDRMVEARKPFLVIEPAKTEYRALHSAIGPRAQLRVYTLGNEMVSPFRLNPFEFETDDEPGSVSLLAHIDFLKAVFNAAFVMYAPMPHVLEEALHEIYEDKGWDLTSGTNRRVSDWSQRHQYPIFPTLTDLYYKVEEVTNRLGYDKEIESNVKASLKTRIGSLRIGSKGLMLDTARGISMHTLLTQPTILELENIGNDDEKTFLMGLFLARLYEYRRLQAANGTLPQGLQHLLVFEEAHRLLKNTQTQVDSESSNMRAQAIEVFTNMLSEVRAYGQGVLVAEQIPGKLAPDVLKNTNLKITHRLIAMDDRQSIGQTMNLNEGQLNHLGILTPGMAVVFAEGADHAYLVRLENYKRKVTPLLDKQLKLMSREYASVASFQMIPDIDQYDVPIGSNGGPDPALYQAAGKLLGSEKSKWLWANILLRLVTSPGTVFQILSRFSEHIEANSSSLPVEQHEALLKMVVVRGAAETIHARGAQFGWSYEQVEELRILLTRGLLGCIHTSREMLQRAGELDEQALTLMVTNMMDTTTEHLERFMQRYIQLTQREHGPLIGCEHCPAKCLYRTEVKVLLSEKDQKWINDELSSETHLTEEDRYSTVARTTIQIAQIWLGLPPESRPDGHTTGIGYCAALHTFAETGFTDYECAVMCESLQPHLAII